MFDLFKKKKKPEKTEAPKAKKSDKELATENKEPWVNVVGVEIDQDDPGNGAFELDWNEYFVAKLVRAGYQKKKDDTDNDIVDRWFQAVCKNVLAENYEQWEADPKVRPRPNEVKRDDGRSEVG